MALSLDNRLTPREHFQRAARLKPLRDENILIVTSGNIVHNLRDFAWNSNTPPFPWAMDFDRQIAAALERRDLDALLGFNGLDPALVRRAVPTPEHYLPLIYALAASDPREPVSFPFIEMQNGSIAMRSVRFG